MRLLNISASFPLLHLRGAFLTALGFEVANALGASKGICALRSGRSCDGAILCHTLSNVDKLRFEAVIEDMRRRPSLIELYLVEMPVTSGIALDAAMDFLPFVNRWAESLVVHQRVSLSEGPDSPRPLLSLPMLFDSKYEVSDCCPLGFSAGPHFRAALRS